jgi:hypothetical protein
MSYIKRRKKSDMTTISIAGIQKGPKLGPGRHGFFGGP